MADERWRERLREIEVVSHEHVPPGPQPEALDAWERETGQRLPRSYREFILQFGPGELGDEYQLFAPAYPEYANGVGLSQFNQEHWRTIDRDRRSEEELSSEYGDAARLRRLVLFASTFGGDRYGWDPEDVRDAEAPEYGIYLIPHPGPIEAAASTFRDFILNTGMLRYVPAYDLPRETPAPDEIEEMEGYDPEGPEYQEVLAFARDGAFTDSEFLEIDHLVIHVLEAQEWNPEDEFVLRFEAWKEARAGGE